MIEREQTFLCPHCGETNTVQLDASAGKSQEFSQDCEVCCRSIKIELEWKAGEIASFKAESED